MTLLFFSLIYGLITNFDKNTENGGLFFSEYLVLKRDMNIEQTELDKAVYETKMERAKVEEGLYRRDLTRTERTVSHDEITGMIVSSKLLGTNHADEIWNYLVKHFFIYDPNKNRPYPAFHPAWIYLWGEWVGSKWSKVFYPFAFINILLTTNKDSQQSTSGKLLYFTLLKRDTLLYKIYVKRMEKLYGNQWVNSIFSIYFNEEPSDHPLRYLPSLYK